MIPCINNLYSIPKLFERHIEGLAGIFYFYFTYFFVFNFPLVTTKQSRIFIYILCPFTVYQLCFHEFNFSWFQIK